MLLLSLRNGIDQNSSTATSHSTSNLCNPKRLTCQDHSSTTSPDTVQSNCLSPSGSQHHNIRQHARVQRRQTLHCQAQALWSQDNHAGNNEQSVVEFAWHDGAIEWYSIGSSHGDTRPEAVPQCGRVRKRPRRARGVGIEGCRGQDGLRSWWAVVESKELASSSVWFRGRMDRSVLWFREKGEGNASGGSSRRRSYYGCRMMTLSRHRRS